MTSLDMRPPQETPYLVGNSGGHNGPILVVDIEFKYTSTGSNIMVFNNGAIPVFRQLIESLPRIARPIVMSLDSD